MHIHLCLLPTVWDLHGFTDMLIMFYFFPFMLIDMLTELSRREKAANIKPDADIDAFMKASINEPCLSLVYFLSLFFISL